MPPLPVTDDPDAIARYEHADVVFVAQDGYRLAPARVRCYSFARLLNRHGLRAEVLSAFDHLGAPLQGSAAAGMSAGEKMAVVQRAYGILRRNPAAVFYVQKVGYHALAPLMAAAENGNRLVLDYDDYEVDLPSFAGLDRFLPSLRTAELLNVLARHSAACVASSHALYDLLRPHNPATHLIHTVADQETFHTGRRGGPRRRFGDAVNVLWCGDVWGDVVMRDVLLAADCFAMLPEVVRRRAQLHVIGFGAAWEDLKARIRTRHPALDAAIVLHEHIPPDAFGEVLAEMDIGLLPYHDNAFNTAKSPTKMFEYMLSGLAVCATPVGEVTHCLEDGQTVLFGTGRQGFSAALGRLIADDALRTALGEAGAALGLARYSLQSAGTRLVDILRAIRGETRLEPGTGPALPDPAAAIAAAMDRRRPVPPREAALALREAAALAGASDPGAVPPRSIAAPVLALLEWPGLAAYLDLTEERRQALAATVRPLRPSASLRRRAGLAEEEARPSGDPPALCKLVSAEDWEDPDWFALAQRYKIGWATTVREGNADDPRSDAYDTAYNWFKRSCGVWERTQFLYALHRLGALSHAARVVVASTDPDGLYMFLSREVACVEVVDVGPGHEEAACLTAAGALDPWMSLPRLFDPGRLRIHHWGEPLRPLDEPADVVLLPQNTAFAGGPARFAALMAWADGQLADGGVLAFSAEVVLNPPAPVPWPILAATGSGGLCDLLARHTSLRPQGAFDAALSDATLDRVAVTGTPGIEHPHFVRDTAGTLHVTGVWVCRKATETPVGAWTALAESAFPQDRMGGIPEEMSDEPA